MEPGSDLTGGGAGSLTSPGRGGILYCVIARGTTVLARFSCLVFYSRCGWFFIQSSGMPHVLETLQRSVILFWRRQDLLPPISNITKFILKVREHNQPKMTLTQGEFLFHYVSDDGVIALAIAGLEYY